MVDRCSCPVIDVTAIDPADLRSFDEWFAVLRATDLERWPEGRAGNGPSVWPGARRQGPEEHRCLVARREGRVVGIADLETFRRENRHIARTDVRVLPEHRRHGVGRALVDGGGTDGPGGRPQRAGRHGRDPDPGRATWTRRARSRVTSGSPSRCAWCGARSPCRSSRRTPTLRRHPKASPAGYTLLTFADRWPDEYVADRCELGRRMSTDVPVGEQELDEEDLGRGSGARHRGRRWPHRTGRR